MDDLIKPSLVTEGSNALHVAVNRKSTDVPVLLDVLRAIPESEIFAIDSRDRTPLDIACELGRSDMGEVIVSFYASIQKEKRVMAARQIARRLIASYQSVAPAVCEPDEHPFLDALTRHIAKVGHSGGLQGLDFAIRVAEIKSAVGTDASDLKFNQAAAKVRKELTQSRTNIYSELRVNRRPHEATLVIDRLMSVVLFFGITPPFDARHLVDYCSSDSESGRRGVLLKSVAKLDPETNSLAEYLAVFQRVVGAVESWDRTRTKAGGDAKAGKDDFVIVSPLKSAGGGMLLVKLTTARAMKFEALRMGHCVGDGGYDSYIPNDQETDDRKGIYSVRSEFGQPRATLEIDRWIRQIKGPRNGPVPPDAIEAVIEAVEFFNMNVSSGDLRNIGYTKVEDWEREMLDYHSVVSEGVEYALSQSKRPRVPLPSTTNIAVKLDVLHLLAARKGAEKIYMSTYRQLIGQVVESADCGGDLLSVMVHAISGKNEQMALDVMRLGNFSGDALSVVAVPNSYGYTPVMAAIEWGMDDLTSRLLDAGIDLEETGQFGCTPLMLAVELGRLEAVALLIAEGAKTTSEKNHCPLAYLAVLHADGDRDAIDMLTLLHRHGVPLDVSFGKRTPLELSDARGYSATVEFLRPDAHAASSSPDPQPQA